MPALEQARPRGALRLARAVLLTVLTGAAAACDHSAPFIPAAPTPTALSTEITSLFVGERSHCTTTPEGFQTCIWIVLFINGMRVNYDLEAMAVFSDSHREDVTMAAAWTSSDPTIATVKDGAVSVARRGAVEIRADYRGFTATYRIDNP